MRPKKEASENNSKVIICWLCNQEGHFRRNCPNAGQESDFMDMDLYNNNVETSHEFDNVPVLLVATNGRLGNEDRDYSVTSN